MTRTVNDQTATGSIGGTIEALLHRSAKRERPMPYSYVLEKVKKDHPEARTTKECVDYYAWNLRRQGIKVKLARSK